MTVFARPRRNALAGDGPIVSRARSALRRVAAQFGEITSFDRTRVSVRTGDGIVLELSYELGNYVFSRVYNLTISTHLPHPALPSGIVLSHRNRSGPRYVRGDGGATPGEAVRRLNEAVGGQLANIDVISSRIDGVRERRTLTLTPVGGSFVWVLIPPVFTATSFPPGEQQRILDLIRTVRGIRPHRAPAAR